MTGYRLVCGFQYLFLGVWLGALIMLAVSAAVTFRTVRSYQPTLGVEPYRQPQFAEHASNILAGAAVGNSLKGLAVIQTICAAGLIMTVILQFTVWRGQLTGPTWLHALRIALLALPILLHGVDRAVITPAVWRERAAMYDPQATEPQREQARTVFQRYHKLNERLVSVTALLLLGAVLVNPFVVQGPRP